MFDSTVQSLASSIALFMCRAQILSKKVSPRAFVEQPNKKGQAAGEVGIEGTAIEAPVEVHQAFLPLIDETCQFVILLYPSCSLFQRASYKSPSFT